MWIFPGLMPMVMLIVMVVVLYLILGRGGFRPPWYEAGRDDREPRDTESALDILKKRYAQWELTKDEFEQIKQDFLS